MPIGSRKLWLLNQSTLQGDELYGFQVAPGRRVEDHLGLERTVDRLGNSTVIAATDATDGELDTGPEQTFHVPNGKIFARPCRCDG